MLLTVLEPWPYCTIVVSKNENESKGKFLKNQIFFANQKSFYKTSLTGWDRLLDFKQVKFVELVQQKSHVQRISPISHCLQNEDFANYT